PLRHSDLGEAFWELTGFGVVRTPKLSELEARAIPGWVTTLGSCSVSSQEQNRAGCPLRHSDLGEAFWELTGFGFVGTPKLSELEAGAIPGWVTPWEVAP
ncbi:cyclic nucleotide gated channel 1, partial [Prunus dulcis]